MDGKFIFLFIVCTSLLSVGISFTCSVSELSCEDQFNNGFVLRYFIIEPSQNLFNSGGEGFVLNEGFRSSIEGSLTPEAGVSGQNPFSVFLDGLKMVIGFLTILTPFPILDMLASLGIPIYIIMFLGIPLFILYIVSMIEFIRGGNF